MSTQSRLAELQRRHQALETELAATIAHPSSADEEIRELKRRKLRVKEEIETLRHTGSVH